jgi:hypothetical protein
MRWTLLLIWPLLAGLHQWLLTPLGGVSLWAAIGSALGVGVWSWGVGQRVRPAVMLLGLPLFGLLGNWLIAALSLSPGLAKLTGPDRWVLWAQAAAAAWTWCCLVGWLRTLSWRWPPAAALELAVVANVFVSALEAHRDGFINRPFQLVDPLWLKGWDPSPLFVAVGAVGLASAAALALNRPDNRRPWWDLPLLLLCVASLYLLAPTAKVKEVLERFGMGKNAGPENRLRPQGQERPNQGKSAQNKPSDGSAGQGQPHPGDQTQQEKDDPSFADTQPPPKSRPVAVVIFRDDYDPPSGAYYFRQTANSQYNGLKLVHSNDDRFDRDEARGFPTRIAPAEEGALQAETLGTQIPTLRKEWFPPLETRVALIEQHPKAFGLNNAVGYWATGNPDPARFQKAYDVESRVFQASYRDLLACAPGDSTWDPEMWKHYLDGPRDRRYRELADKIVAGLTPDRRQSPLFKAVAIKLWLDENCTYSLKSPSKEAADPVSDFLFGQRIGYCVYTSHSACYLYRAAGVPARIANGYMVSSQQRAGGSSLLIRSGDAHSWPEICLQGAGWLDLDIAPKKNLEPENEQVDNNLQQMMGDMARKDKKQPRPEEDKPAVDLQKLLGDSLRQLATALPWALLAVWLGLSSWKWWRRVAPWAVGGRTLPRWAYLCVLDILAEQGTTRRLDETREGFARRLAHELPALHELTALHQRSQLGRGANASNEEVRGCLQACLEQLRRRRVAGWRKWFGWLDAGSGLRVR